MKTDDWRGLYREGWRGEIVAGAFAHPAKYARALVRRIFEHAAAEGWVRPGDGVVDPFGGVALGALDAMRLGLHWHGVELEPRFVDLGNANIALWNGRYSPHFERWGTARLTNGDSRNLAEIMTGWQALAVSSPPYVETAVAKNSTGVDIAKQYATYRASGGGQSFDAFQVTQQRHSGDYGDTPGQLGAMPAGDFDLAVSSPPYADGARQQGNDLHPERMEGTAHAPARYDLAVSSPPYEHRSYEGMSASFAEWREMQGRDNDKPGAQGVTQGYGQTVGQLAGADDFWTAARAIVEQTYAVLAPGGHACWVVKDFVRDGQRVEFSDQWRQLCEAVGFTTLHCHRAWVVEHHGTQKGLDGQDKEHRVERKSFFRRLAEKKGSPRIDWETVYCMEKSA